MEIIVVKTGEDPALVMKCTNFAAGRLVDWLQENDKQTIALPRKWWQRHAQKVVHNVWATGGVICHREQWGTYPSLIGKTSPVLPEEEVIIFPGGIPPWVEVEGSPCCYCGNPDWSGYFGPVAVFADDVKSLIAEWLRGIKTPEPPPWLGGEGGSCSFCGCDYGGYYASVKPGTTLEEIWAWAENIVTTVTRVHEVVYGDSCLTCGGITQVFEGREHCFKCNS